MHVKGPEVVKCSYKPLKETSAQAAPEFFVICNQGLPEQYRKKAASLVDTVQSFDIWTHAGAGTTGALVHANKTQLDEYFGSHDEAMICDVIVREGRVQPYELKITGKGGVYQK